VQRRSDIAQAGDVQFLDRPSDRLADGSHGAAGENRLFDQQGPFGGRQLLDLGKTLAARDKHDPGIAGVLLQPRVAKFERHEGRGGGGDGRSHGEGHGQRRLGMAAQ
jgi:hypothetical protein